MKSLQGQLLVASPQLLDPNFRQTVILVVTHDESGAFGVVLNRPSEKSISELWKLVSVEYCDNHSPVHGGGPVDGPMLAIHAEHDCGEVELSPGVFMTSRQDQILMLLNENRSPLKVFVGYAGWGGGQLEGEIDTGSWLILPASSENVFEVDEGEIWDVLVTRAQSLRTKKILRVKNFGDDPSLN